MIAFRHELSLLLLSSFCIGGLWPAPVCAQATTGLDGRTRVFFQAMVKREMERKNIPGLSVAIGVGGEIVWNRGFGHSDLENKVAATEHTSYRLASISKTITAVAAMQLAEAGKLDLDAPVQTYLPEFPKKRWPVTSRQLLSHLGGVRHYSRDRAEINSAKFYPTVRAGLVIFADDPLLHEPGSKYSYTTYGYNLLGAVVAAAADSRFDALVQRAVFDPAEMKHCQVDSAQRLIQNRAQGYRKVRGQIRNSALVDTSNKIPGGGFCSTASDLVIYGQALLTGKLLPRKTLDQMWTPAKTTAGKTLAYGLGFRIIEADKPRVVGHSGGQPRVNTMLILRPDDGVVVAVMCNLEGAGLADLARQLAENAIPAATRRK